MSKKNPVHLITLTPEEWNALEKLHKKPSRAISTLMKLKRNDIMLQERLRELDLLIHRCQTNLSKTMEKVFGVEINANGQVAIAAGK